MPASKKTSNQASTAALTKFEETFAKNYGAHTLTRSNSIKAYEVIPTGSLTLDLALGVGGWVEGRLHEIWGPEGIGKSTLAMMAVAEAQRKYPKKMCGWVDAEHKADKAWMRDHGVDLNRLYFFDPDNAEDVADAIKDMLRSGVISLVVLDSIGSMIPEAEKEKDADKAVMAVQAKIVTRMVKIAAVEAARTNTTLILINQVRANLAYGADTTTGGGFALRHATTTKIKMKRTGTLPYKAKVMGEDVIVGHEIAAYVERNGVAPAYRTGIFSMFNQPTLRFGPLGVDVVDETASLGIQFGAIKQTGGWFTLPDGERVQGRPAVVKALRDDPDMVSGLRTAVLEAKGAALDETPPDEIEEPAEEIEGETIEGSVVQPLTVEDVGAGPAFKKGMDG